MSEPINQPGATTASIPLPGGWVLDKGEQPRRPNQGERYFTSEGTVGCAAHGWKVSKRFIVVRSTPDDSWWPEWLKADCVAMTVNGSWVAFEKEPSVFHDGAWVSYGGRTLFLPEWFFSLPDWPTDRWQESKIMNPHKRGEQ